MSVVVAVVSSWFVNGWRPCVFALCAPCEALLDPPGVTGPTTL